MSLTGNKDIDCLILLRIRDSDLIKFFYLNKYTQKLCNCDIFWRKKCMVRFNLSIKEFLVIERYLGNPKDIYKYFMKNYMKLLIPFVKDIKFIQEFETIVKALLPDTLPTWINSNYFIFEFRKKLLTALFEGIMDNKFVVQDIWRNFSPLKIDIPDRTHYSDKVYIKVSDNICGASNYLYQSRNYLNSLF